MAVEIRDLDGNILKGARVEYDAFGQPLRARYKDANGIDRLAEAHQFKVKTVEPVKQTTQSKSATVDKTTIPGEVL